MKSNLNDTEEYQVKDGEKFMSAEQVKYFKNKLIAWKKQLIADANVTINHIKSNDNHVADANDRATLEEEFTLELKARDRENKLISKIDQALHTIELEEYGYCATCGAEIGLSRLEARPTAEECIDCKTISERKEL